MSDDELEQLLKKWMSHAHKSDLRGEVLAIIDAALEARAESARLKSEWEAAMALGKRAIVELDERRENPTICVRWPALEAERCGCCEPCRLSQLRAELDALRKSEALLDGHCNAHIAERDEAVAALAAQVRQTELVAGDRDLAEKNDRISREGWRLAQSTIAALRAELEAARAAATWPALVARAERAEARVEEYRREVERRDELLAASSPAAIAEQVESGVVAAHGALQAELETARAELADERESQRRVRNAARAVAFEEAARLANALTGDVSPWIVARQIRALTLLDPALYVVEREEYETLKGKTEHESDFDAPSGLHQIQRWWKEASQKILAEGNIPDTGFRCVSEGGDVFEFDPDTLLQYDLVEKETVEKMKALVRVLPFMESRLSPAFLHDAAEIAAAIAVLEETR